MGFSIEDGVLVVEVVTVMVVLMTTVVAIDCLGTNECDGNGSGRFGSEACG